MERRATSGGLPRVRGFLRLGRAAAVVMVMAGCFPDPVGVEAQSGSGRLTARPGTPTLAVEPGRHELGFGAERDGVLFVPTSYRPDAPAPLILFFHGAGGSAEPLEPLFELAEEAGAVMLLPESRGRTWDGSSRRFGIDVAFLARALEHVFEQLAVDPRRVAISGFSDGGSYALSLGLANGDLFSHEEFDGPHVISLKIVREALAWFRE